MKNFRAKTVLGLKWNLVNRLSAQFLSLVIGIILARLLLPEEFGIVGMVFVFTGFAGVFVDFGFTSALIQNKESDTRHWSSVFWLNLVFSVLLALLFTAGAPLLAGFYELPELKNVAIVISWSLVLRAFTLVQLSLLKKELKFKEIAKVQLVGQLIGGTLAIAAAYNGFSYWSLVIQIYIASLVKGGLLWFGTTWRPQLIFDRSAIREMLDFSLPLIGMQTTHYWAHNMDSLIVGKMLGGAALGIYGRAYSLMLLPLQSVSQVISSVMFPAYALIQNDPDRIRRSYTSINRMIAMITFPMMAGLVVTASPFVYAVLGEQWAGAIPVIQILAPLGAWRAVHTLSGNVFMAIGKTKALFKITLSSSIIAAAGMIIGVYVNGLEGLAIGYGISSIFTGLLLDYFLEKFIGLNIVHSITSLLPMLLASLVMCTAVYFVDLFWNERGGHALTLLVLVLTGVAVYALLSKLMGLDKELLNAVSSRQKMK